VFEKSHARAIRFSMRRTDVSGKEWKVAPYFKVQVPPAEFEPMVVAVELLERKPS
jgi:hypothetical protein